MSKLSYGGFELDPESEKDDGWTKLDTVVEHLEAGEALSPYLARWLANAIERSNRNTNELLRLLQLKDRAGRKRYKFTGNNARDIGRYLCELEDSGLKPREAMKRFEKEYYQHFESVVSALEISGLSFGDAIAEATKQMGPHRPSTTLLKRWRNDFRQAKSEYEAMNDCERSSD
jgi:hypothetical protein